VLRRSRLARRHYDDSDKTGRENAIIANDADDGRSVALYWDFENLHAGLIEARYGEGAYAKRDNRFRVQEPLIDVQALVELCASFGPVAVDRAYGNWQYFGRYRDALLQSAVELIQLLPPGASAKNGADIKLWRMIKRLDATFDPRDHGYAHFAEMVKAMDAVVEFEQGKTDHMLRVR
jgi:hypothetical protein